MNCENCKHFVGSWTCPTDLGLCVLRLPVWVFRLIGAAEPDHEKYVYKNDTCSFFDEVKK